MSTHNIYIMYYNSTRDFTTTKVVSGTVIWPQSYDRHDEWSTDFNPFNELYPYFCYGYSLSITFLLSFIVHYHEPSLIYKELIHCQREENRPGDKWVVFVLPFPLLQTSGKILFSVVVGPTERSESNVLSLWKTTSVYLLLIVLPGSPTDFWGSPYSFLRSRWPWTPRIVRGWNRRIQTK